MEKLKVVFICGKNLWRSPTAETLYRNDARLAVRSAGLSPKSPRVVGLADLNWAELVFVMEQSHKQQLRNQLRKLDEAPEVVCLDIPDEYPYMNAELQDLLKQGIEGELEDWLEE